MAENEFDVVIAIVNSGFGEDVIDAARNVGAKGGTILHGRGAVSKDVAERIGLTINPDKDIVLILLHNTIRDDILSAINVATGVKTAANGIFMSIPCNDVVGID